MAFPSERSSASSDRRLAYALLRAIVGVNLGVHGISRLLAGPLGFAASLVGQFHATPLPSWSVFAFGLLLPWVETVLGLLLLLGLAMRFALVAASLTILALTFGSCLRQDWQSAGLQLIYAAIYAALLAFRSENSYSLDGILPRRDSPLTPRQSLHPGPSARHPSNSTREVRRRWPILHS